MKKVGILTFWKSYNYGSALQAYALAYKLKELGFVAEIINYTQYNFGYNYGNHSKTERKLLKVFL